MSAKFKSLVPSEIRSYYSTSKGTFVKDNLQTLYLLLARIIREISFGFIAIALPFYWHDSGISSLDIGILYTIVLLASALASLTLGRHIDSIGRKKLLMLSTLLWSFATPFLLVTHSIIAITLIATLATVSPTGKEIGLYLGIEQAALSKLVSGHDRTRTYARFNFVGYTSTAVGAFLAAAVGLSGATSLSSVHSTNIIFTVIVVCYTLAGILQFILYSLLGPGIEVAPPSKDTRKDAPLASLSKSTSSAHTPTRDVRKVVMTFTALFTLDAFSAGLIVQGLLVYWFRIRFHFDLTQLGALFFGTNLLSAISSLVASRLANKFGLLNTMVFTHLPSNILLILVPLMPNAYLAVLVLLLRHMLSQMDVPTRQAYTMAMVDTEDRAYLSSWTNGARSLGTGASPIIAGALINSGPLLSLPFFLAGGIKVVYDVVLYRIFKKVPLKYFDTK